MLVVGSIKSNKTEILWRRYVELVNSGVSPEKILYGGKSLQELKSVGNLDEALESIKSELKIMDKSASSELFEISEVEYKGGNENFTALLLTVGEKIA